MSKKGGKAKPKAKAKAAADEENVVTRQMVVGNYGKLCKSIGVAVNTHVNEVLRGSAEDEQELVNFILEGEFGSLGPGGVRAITMAFLISFFVVHHGADSTDALEYFLDSWSDWILYGVGPGITSGPYKHLRYIRIWNQDVGNEGAAAIATLLQSTSPSINIAYLELLDCGIGDGGCRAIADVLKTQKQPGLLTLNLDYNSDISDAGVSLLCDALFTNTTLKKLHLDYCNIGPTGAIKLAQVVAMPLSAVTMLSLQGNSFGDEGLYHFSLGLARAQHLVTLNLADNGIRNNEEALMAFRDAVVRCKSLAHIDFTNNPIEPDGAALLLPIISPENAKLQSFQVDASLPVELFAKLNRAPKGDGKKGKKKGGKKKK